MSGIERWYSERDVGRLLFSLQVPEDVIADALAQFERQDVPTGDAVLPTVILTVDGSRLGMD